MLHIVLDQSRADLLKKSVFLESGECVIAVLVLFQRYSKNVEKKETNNRLTVFLLCHDINVM